MNLALSCPVPRRAPALAPRKSLAPSYFHRLLSTAIELADAGDASGAVALMREALEQEFSPEVASAIHAMESQAPGLPFDLRDALADVMAEEIVDIELTLDDVLPDSPAIDDRLHKREVTSEPFEGSAFSLDDLFGDELVVLDEVPGPDASALPPSRPGPAAHDSSFDSDFDLGPDVPAPSVDSIQIETVSLEEFAVATSTEPGLNRDLDGGGPEPSHALPSSSSRARYQAAAPPPPAHRRLSSRTTEERAHPAALDAEQDSFLPPADSEPRRSHAPVEGLRESAPREVVRSSVDSSSSPAVMGGEPFAWATEPFRREAFPRPESVRSHDYELDSVPVSSPSSTGMGEGPSARLDATIEVAPYQPPAQEPPARRTQQTTAEVSTTEAEARRAAGAPGPDAAVVLDPAEVARKHLAQARAARDRGDLAMALTSAEAALSFDEGNPDVLSLIQSVRRQLLRIKLDELEPLSRVPTVNYAMMNAMMDSLNQKLAFIFQLADGMNTLQDIIDISGLPAHEAAEHLTQLVEWKLLEFHD